MPSVGLRRTTRVFGVVKGVDGARVLRSGRRLWPESGEGRFKRANDGDEWLHSLIKTTNKNVHYHHHQNNNGVVKCKYHGWAHEATSRRQEASHAKIGVSKREFETRQEVPDTKIGVSKSVKFGTLDGDGEDKMFGIVYSRKRKRLSDVDKHENLDGKRYGIQFSRRQRRNKQWDGESTVNVECPPEPDLTVVVEGSCNEKFRCILSLVLRYIKRVSLRFSDLAAFLFSEPISSVFASKGIYFLQDPVADRTGICKFYGARQFVPLVSVDFSAIPLCFMYMHLSLFLRVKFLSVLPVNNTLDEDECDEVMSEDEVEHSSVHVKLDKTKEKTLVSEIVNSENNKVVLHPSVRASKLSGRNTPYRNALNSRGIQKRRSSLRRRRNRNPFLLGMHKESGALVSDLISSRRNGMPFSSVVSKNELRSSGRSSSAASPKELSSTMVGATRDMDLTRCSANVLVIESDRCYRIGGVTVTLEISDSGEWVLVVKKDGSARYTHLAQKNMKPCFANRITHDIIWTENENWKLEFPSRQDWFIFKDLYKECSDRNVAASVSKAIPIPGVREVLGYGDSNGAPFSRPDAYISLNNDEVARALARRTSNYDMDSEDEEWLKKFNNEFLAEADRLPEDKFELMIDTLEKAFYCSPYDLADEKEAVNLCMELVKREVVEAVYGYWMKKRKQKRAALLGVFQGHQAKKPALIPKSVLRKRRSFKRQTSNFGRGKQPNLLQAMAAEQQALEEQDALFKVEEANSSLRRSVESAIVKRRRAQLLMENADLATYKAAIALQIAEAAVVPASTDDFVSHFFD